MVSQDDHVEFENFRLIVESNESDTYRSVDSSELVRNRSPRSSKRTRNCLFCNHCNHWIAKSAFYRHKVLCATENKKESDEDSTDDILQDILNNEDAVTACVTEHDRESDKDSIDDVLEGIAHDMESTVSPSRGVNVKLPEPEASVNEDFDENWLTKVAV